MCSGSFGGRGLFVGAAASPLPPRCLLGVCLPGRWFEVRSSAPSCGVRVLERSGEGLGRGGSRSGLSFVVGSVGAAWVGWGGLGEFVRVGWGWWLGVGRRLTTEWGTNEGLEKAHMRVGPERLGFTQVSVRSAALPCGGSKQEVRVLGAKRILALGSVAALCAGAAPLFMATAAHADAAVTSICVNNLGSSEDCFCHQPSP